MSELLTDIEKDALKEIGNIGSGNATSKLANLINEKIDMNLTEISIVPVKTLEEIKGGTKDTVVSIFLRVKGSVFGTIATIIRKDLAIKLVDLMRKQEIGTTRIIDKDCETQFNILGKELANAYLNSLYQFLEIDLDSSEPIIAVNQKEIIVNFLIRGITSSLSDTVLSINTHFDVTDKGIRGEFLLYFGLESLDEFREIIHSKLVT